MATTNLHYLPRKPVPYPDSAFLDKASASSAWTRTSATAHLQLYLEMLKTEGLVTIPKR